MSQFENIAFKSNVLIFSFFKMFYFISLNNTVSSCLPCIQNNNKVNCCALWANQAHKHSCVSVHWPIFGCLH